MTNRKAAYVDFSKPEYSSLPDEEVQALKRVNSMPAGRKNLRNCKTHGIVDQVYIKIRNVKDADYYGCPFCLEKFRGN